MKEKRTTPNLRNMMSRNRNFVFQEILILQKLQFLKNINPFLKCNQFCWNEEDNDVQENVDNDVQNDSYQVINEPG